MPAEPTSAGAARRPELTLYLVFLLSGASALIYEVSWSRQVGLVVGHTARAAALVLGAYFVGLAVGQFLGARLARGSRPLFAYGVAEMLVATLAGAVPALLARVGDLAPVGIDGDVAREALCFVSLLPTTIALGTTFPLMAEHLSRRDRTGRRLALAYAVNTTGGLLGVVAATVFVLVIVGVQTSGYLAAGVSALSGIVACAWSVCERETSHLPREPRDTVGADEASVATSWQVVATASGFGMLGLEVLYTRMFALVFHNSTYTFGAVLAVFLAGLAFGALLVAAIGRRVPPRSLAAGSCALGTGAVATSVMLFVRLTGLEYFSAGQSFGSYLTGVLGIVAVVVLPPTVLLGMVLPAALVAATGSDRSVGRLAAANTLAAGAGALVTGFVCLPWLGLWGAMSLYSFIFGCVSVILFFRSLVPALVAVACLAVACTVAATISVPEPSGDELVVKRWESTYGWVDVVRSNKDGSLAVRQNLHYRHGSTGRNAVREYRQGRLPLLLHPRPREVAILGLGTGLSAAPAAADRDVEGVVVTELVPEVVEASRLLGEANLHVVDHPKVEMRVGDARQYLHRTERRFDVIISDLFVPWESRTGYLYTTDFYGVVRGRLKPGGHFCQWLALYQLGSEEFELICNSFATVFPESTLWWGQFDAKYPMVALVGSERPLDLDYATLHARFEALGEMPGRPDPDLSRPADIPSLYLGQWAPELGCRLNTDEQPRLEFSAPISQRARRTLSGPHLRAYFDEALVKLSPGRVRFSEELRPRMVDRERLAVQRLSLFGGIDP